MARRIQPLSQRLPAPQRFRNAAAGRRSPGCEDGLTDVQEAVIVCDGRPLPTLAAIEYLYLNKPSARLLPALSSVLPTGCLLTPYTPTAVIELSLLWTTTCLLLALLTGCSHSIRKL
jgi:hypothetical protein